VLVGFFQEYKAQISLEKLKTFIILQATVMRDGKIQTIKAEELVPGDIILLEPGDKIPADARVIQSTGLSVNEAVLTGESMPVDKSVIVETRRSASQKKLALGDQKNMLFKGTTIVAGRGRAVVVQTGVNTVLGKIAEKLSVVEDQPTPFQIKLKQFAKTLSMIVLALTVLVVVVGMIADRPFWEMFLVAVAMAVSAVPEGLLIAVTAILAIGMQRILKRKALVKQMLAAETLGSVSVLCVDKTGTMTQGKMQVDFIHSFDQEKFIQYTTLCNNAIVQPNKKFFGSLTEVALLRAALDRGVNYKKLILQYPRLQEIPFTSKEKAMYTLHEDKKQALFIAKGAPEKILKMCDLTEKKRAELQKYFSEKSRQGFRMLATAYKPVQLNVDIKEQVPSLGKLGTGSARDDRLIFLGFWGLRDPLRPNARQTIEQAQAAGIKIVMITGDHKLTAKHIAQDLGLEVNSENILTGPELQTMSTVDLKKRVKNITVYARVSPEDKLRIVKAWQHQHAVVGMTGDGVNDALALKSADIGITMGVGSEVSKESSDVVLLNNNLSTIVNAVKQGRVIWVNIKKVVVYLLSDSFSELLLVTGSLLFGLPLPITAAQILWINLIDDTLPSVALTVDPAAEDVMKQKPVPKKQPLLDKQMKIIIAAITIVVDLFLFAIFWFLYQKTGDLVYVRTFIFAALGIDSLIYVFSCRSMHKSIFKMPLFNNRFLLGAVFLGFILQALPIYVPALQKVFQTIALGGVEWVVIFGLAFFKVLIIELIKYISSYGCLKKV